MLSTQILSPMYVPVYLPSPIIRQPQRGCPSLGEKCKRPFATTSPDLPVEAPVNAFRNWFKIVNSVRSFTAYTATL